MLVPGRDRYLDLLRAIALVRVVAFHTFYQAVWLSVIFPSIGVMFALAGALMARSLDRPTGQVFKSRMKRLLLPLWLYSAVVVGVLVLQGWRPDAGDVGGWWLQLTLWFLPIGDPPFPVVELDSPLAWGEIAVIHLWYIRAYFWFVLLSPLMLAAFKRLPFVALAAPLALIAALEFGLIPIQGPVASVVYDFATFGACWMLGFAYQRGVLHSLRRVPTVLVALAIMAVGLGWAAGHSGDAGWDLGQIPLAQALWSFGFVALLLRISPSWSALPGFLRPFDGFITLINNRAITVYLWHIPLLVAVVPLIDLLWQVPFLAEGMPWLIESQWLQFAAVWVLLGLVILAIGWVEDLAASRPLRLWPDGRRRNASARRLSAQSSAPPLGAADQRRTSPEGAAETPDRPGDGS
ncbi:acyltransferase [Herbiconiux sp. L3-i23]|uniref:acyltransferase family protein n=1 Tax=Herbiconiux sp. L3-i23 TaxID=2905871 RepID=UPI00204BF7DF|nr:acyltransferase [Herbiconiux sp. L3-i23]BDI23010.1 membrane protein [Herbiconiux sp. L3-i23]